MATTETNAVLGNLNWVSQALVGGVASAATAPKVKKTTKTERKDDVLAYLLPFADIQSDVEEGLKASIRDALGTLNALLADDKTTSELQALLGSPGEAGTVAQSVRDLGEAFARLAELPNPTADGVVAAATSFSDKLKTATRRIQGLRGQADSELNATVEQANTVLKQIADLNARVALNAATGSSSHEIGAERDAALSMLSGALDFASFNREDGTVSVFTKSGTPLVTGSAVTLHHRKTEGIEPSMTLAKGDLSGVMANGVDISSHLTAGTIHSLLETRDTTLPNVQNQLDTLAQTLQSQLNQASNRAIAGSGATPSYQGTRRFANPAGQRISLSGGDSVVSLTGPNGAVRASLTHLVRRYRQASGLPTAGNWPVSQVAAALNQWIGRQAGGPPAVYASIGADGNLAIAAPQGAVVGFADQRSMALQSTLAAPPDKPLGLTGPLSFTDGAGNRLSTGRANPSLVVAPADSLSAIAAKLNAVDGVTASLVPTDQGSYLRVTGTTASDITVDPDGPGASVAAGLGLLPAADQPAEDVVVNYQSDDHAQSFSTAPWTDVLGPLGLGGAMTVRDHSGGILAQLVLDPAWSLKALAANLSGAMGRPTGATIQPVGNQFFLKISVPVGQQLSIDGAPDSLQTPPLADFHSSGGVLSMALDGVAVGRLDLRAGDDLEAIAAAINDPGAPFAAKGIQAALSPIGSQFLLEIAHAGGLPLGVDGSATGSGPGKLALRLNPRDSLGLVPAAHQVVSGLANFFGLNDVFVADPPEAFDSKAPTGIFTSTATAGTARTLAINPILRTNPGLLSDGATARRLSEALRAELNLGAAGGLPRGSHGLADYADKIAATASANAKAVKSRLVYQQTLLDGLMHQRTGVSDLDMNDAVANLTTFQQAFDDASRVVSTMSQLFGSLDMPVH